MNTHIDASKIKADTITATQVLPDLEMLCKLLHFADGSTIEWENLPKSDKDKRRKKAERALARYRSTYG